MYLTKEVKEKIFLKHGKLKKNTGSTEAQIALFSFRIDHLSSHFSYHDYNH